MPSSAQTRRDPQQGKKGFSKNKGFTVIELLIAVAVIAPQQNLTLHSGKRHITLKKGDLEHYSGERGRRGNKLPRGFQRVDSITVE